MHTLSASDLLQVWEWGQGRSPVQQALIILAAAYPGVDPNRLAQLSIGQRDAQLLALRSHTFGNELHAVAHCPNCKNALEYTLFVDDIANTPIEDLGQDLKTLNTSEAPEDKALEDKELAAYHWMQDNYRVRFRLPNSADFLAIADTSSQTLTSQAPFLQSAPGQILSACILSMAQGEQTVELSELPETIVQALSQHISEQDPQAETLLNMNCPECEHQWQTLFDIVSFFWREISTAAQRLLQEVHLLAFAYSWREADILAMSSRRRQAYLEQISHQTSGAIAAL